LQILSSDPLHRLTIHNLSGSEEPAFFKFLTKLAGDVRSVGGDDLLPHPLQMNAIDTAIELQCSNAKKQHAMQRIKQTTNKQFANIRLNRSTIV
jgi:hypothetical protein